MRAAIFFDRGIRPTSRAGLDLDRGRQTVAASICVKSPVNDDGAANHNGGRALDPNRNGGRDRRDDPSHARVHGPG
jgi:hypothetical protein